MNGFYRKYAWVLSKSELFHSLYFNSGTVLIKVTNRRRLRPPKNRGHFDGCCGFYIELVTYRPNELKAGGTSAAAVTPTFLPRPRRIKPNNCQSTSICQRGGKAFDGHGHVYSRPIYLRGSCLANEWPLYITIFWPKYQ